MGWRAWNNYDEDAHKAWRALPWRERYNWRGLTIFALIVALSVIYLWNNLQ
jgi:hypothetical protein